MSTLRLKHGLGAAAVATALLLVGACGGGGSADSGSATTGSSASPDAGSTSPGAGGTPSGDTSAQPDGDSSDAASATGDIGEATTAALKKAGSFTFEISSSAAGQKIDATGAASYRGDQPASRTTMSVAGQKLQIRVVDGVYYMKSPLLQADRPWLKIDPKDKSGLGALIGQMGGSGDPSASLKALDGATEVTRVGTGTVDGVRTTHYRMVVPRHALAKSLHYPDQMTSMLPKKVTYQVWVDSADRPRRVSTRMKVAGKAFRTRITMEDFGKSVSIKAPPADKVTTKSALTGAAK